MTQNDDDDPLFGRDAAKARLIDLAHAFAEMLAALKVLRANLGPETVDMSSQINKQFKTLQEAHHSLLRAEQSFREKFGDADDVAGPDYDVLRLDIGRALDRIRDSSSAGGVFKRSE